MKLTIYHTNDIHSNFDKLAQIAAYINKNRTAEDFYFDCGDLCDLKDVMVQGTNGGGAIRLLKAAGVNAMAVGNNEIDLADKALSACAGQGLPLLSCNVTDNALNELENINRSVIFERMGVRFLVIGVSPYYGYSETKGFQPGKYNVFFEMGNIKTVEPIEQIRKELQKQAGAYDFCILLSHSGCFVEEMIMKQVPEIDLCLGGHSHTVSCEKRYINSGCYGQYIGKVQLEIEGGKVTDISTELIENKGFTDAPEITELYEKETEEAARLLDKTLYTVDELSWDFKKENLLTNFIAEALYAKYPCDLAFTNAGIVEGSIKGGISKQKLLELSPSKLNPTRYPVKGCALKEAICHSLDGAFVSQPAPGAGVRWSVLGTLGFSHNVSIQKEPFLVLVNGEPLDEEREYLCVAHDALQRGTGYKELAAPDEKAEYFYGFIRDLLEATLQNPEILQNAGKQRIVERR